MKGDNDKHTATDVIRKLGPGANQEQETMSAEYTGGQTLQASRGV